jgi:hypothetical protein
MVELVTDELVVALVDELRADKEREGEKKWQKQKGGAGFWSTLDPHFFMPRPLNPPLFIRDKSG